MTLELNQQLNRYHALEHVDIVPGEPDTTLFKRIRRLRQSIWRENNNFPIGTQTMHPRKDQKSRPLGSRIDFSYGMDNGVNFLNEDIREAVNNRINHPEPHEMIDKDRLFCDLLSSMPMCFNLFGSLQKDLVSADAKLHLLCPDAPGKVSALRFEWSPGRQDAHYLGNSSAFDVAFEIKLNNGQLGLLAIETKYHEHCKTENIPESNKLKRYLEVSTKSAVFKTGAVELILGSKLQQIWMDHLLALSLLQHPDNRWEWVKFVLVYPCSNPSFKRVAKEYGALLVNEATFDVITVEEVLSKIQLPIHLKETFYERYL